MPDDRENVLNKVQNDGLALQYASEDMQADEEIVLESVRRRMLE